jgi:hypothetical protein
MFIRSYSIMTSSFIPTSVSLTGLRGLFNINQCKARVCPFITGQEVGLLQQQLYFCLTEPIRVYLDAAETRAPRTN